MLNKIVNDESVNVKVKISSIKEIIRLSKQPTFGKKW